MIYESDRSRRRNRIPFGSPIRGLHFEEVSIEYDDIHTMLDMPEKELKANLYTILRGMDNRRSRGKHHPSNDRDARHWENPYTAQQAPDTWSNGWPDKWKSSPDGWADI